MPRDDYYDDDFGDDLYDSEDEFGAEAGFSELDPDDESLGEEDYGDEGLGDENDSSESAESAESVGSAEEMSLEELLAESASAVGSEDDQLAWRETYFILFQKHERPTLTQVESALGVVGRRLVMEHLTADDDGLFQSVLVQSPEDNAALEISYEEGEAVMEQSAELAKHLQRQVESDVLARLLRADARLDVMHFERMDDATPLAEEGEDDIALEALNPATLIAAVESLAGLTDGVPIDPSAGEIMV